MPTLIAPETHIVPATADKPTAQRAASPAKTQRSTRVLLVEDEPLTSEVFARALSRDGHVVDVAKDGLQALRRLRERLPSIVVLDMSLPALSGADVVRELRSSGHLDLPIVVVSGSDRRDTRLSDAELTPGAWLCKPLKPRELVAMVRQLTARSDGSLPKHD
jgi:two-component system, OmpR family, response regulator RegX3